MTTSTISFNLSQILALYLLLIAFGAGYGALVRHAERKGYTEGFTWLAAGIWALVTVGAMAPVCWQMALILAGAFLCSGAPIAARMIWHYVKLREQDQLCLRANIAEEDENNVQ